MTDCDSLSHCNAIEAVLAVALVIYAVVTCCKP